MAGEGKKMIVGQPQSLQILKKTEELKRIVLGCKRDLYTDRDGWTSHQQLSAAYKTLLITDLEFALDRKVEQELWNNCFKHYITSLQARVKDKRTRGEAQMTLSWFLDNASGFYIILLEEVCTAFGISVPFIQSGDPYGTWSHMAAQGTSAVTKPTKTSCNYLCQHFLVHLGDIARYRSQDRQAETFYRHAISLSPSSGQPYNQIAILEASRGNKLSTVYFYVRSVSLKHPFPAASTNLSRVLGKLGGEGDHEKDRTARVTSVTFVPLFLRLHGLLHHTNRLQTAVKISLLLSESLTNLVVGESLSTWQLIQVIAINMWCWSQVRERQVEYQETDLTREERLVAGVVANLQAAFLSASLLPVYTVKKGKELLDYFALPATRLVLDWIVANPLVLHEHGFTSRAQIWPGLARLLNEAQPLLQDYNPDDMVSYPLPEDYDLQSFTPLSSTLSKLDMRSVSRSQPIRDQGRLGLLRLYRLRETGLQLASLQPAVIRCNNEEWSATELELGDGEDPMVLVAEIDNLHLDNIESSEEEDTHEEPVWETPAEEKTKGILKNEKQTPSPLSSNSPSPMVNKSAKQSVVRNVAMAAILKRAGMSEEASEDQTVKLSEKKTVMFQTPSPVNSQTTEVQSPSEEEIPFTLLPNPPAPPRPRTWSPPTVLERPKVSVDQLDMTVPPPSLHSNFRPPSLNSPTTRPQNSNMQGIQPIRGDMMTGQPMRGELMPGQPMRGELMPGQGQQMRGDILPGQPMRGDMLSGQPMRGDQLSGQPMPGPNNSVWGNRQVVPPNRVAGAPPDGSPSHNPLLQLISHVERPPNTFSGPSIFSGQQQAPASSFLQPGPQSASNAWPTPQQEGQTYSLFSPSAWPGPLLSSPHGGQGSPQASNLPLFGVGTGENHSSPLERLLHQNNKGGDH